MRQRGCGMGVIVTVLGLALSCCLLPYLISSIYSIVSAILQVPGAPNWLWGDWIGSVAGTGTPVYMFLSEGPICCVGILGLLTVVLGVVAVISGMGREEEGETDEYEYDIYQDLDY
jgi:hypothetical protein